MARILVFDHSATVGSAGTAVDMTIAASLTAVTAKRSTPVRLTAARENIRDVGWEFLLTGTAAANVYWHQEYYGDDKGWVANRDYPDSRVFPGANPNWPWMREQSAELAGSGVVNHYHVQRRIAMDPTVSGANNADSRFFPMVVAAPWVRLAIWTPDASWDANNRLRVWAHVAGYADEEYLEALTTPFQYNT